MNANWIYYNMHATDIMYELLKLKLAHFYPSTNDMFLVNKQRIWFLFHFIDKTKPMQSMIFAWFLKSYICNSSQMNELFLREI
jgi:hypothetical protein